MAIYTVSDLSDSGANTLRTLIGTANGTVGVADLIQFGTAGTVTLQSDLPDLTENLILDFSNLNVTIASIGTSQKLSLGAQTLTVTGTGTLTIAAPITGTGSVDQTGGGTLTYTGSNNYTGTTTVSFGTLVLASTTNSAIRDTANVSVGAAGTLSVQASETIGLLSGTSASIVTIAAGQILTTGLSGNSTFAGTLQGSGEFQKGGSGTLTLGGTNTISGRIVVLDGTLRLSSGTAVADSGLVYVTGGTTLAIDSSETLDRLTTFPTSSVVVASGETLTVGAGGSGYTIQGTLSGAGNFAKTGAGTIVLSGTNSFSGLTTVSGGTLTVAGGAALSDTSRTIMQTGATLALNAGETVGSITGAGTISLGSNTLTAGGDNSDTGFSGALTGTGNLVKTGTGTLTLTGTSTYSGSTTVAAGKLVVDGSASAASTTIASGGTLGGHGTLGAVTVQSGGVLAPGNSPGILNTGNLALAAGSTTQIELNGATVGTQYDQLNVTGTVSLGGTLSVSLGFTPTIGQQYTIVANDGADAVTGTFTGIGEGGTLRVGGWDFKVSYVGGDGNDVVLTAMGLTPPPSTGVDPSAQLTGGFLRLQSTSDAGSILSGTKGDDLFVGGAGVDTVLEQGVRFADARITLNADGTVRVVSANGTDTLRNVEKIAFADGTLDMTITGQRALAIETIYHVALGRAPDAAGLAVQMNSGLDVNTLARLFSTTPEFQKWNAVADVDFVRMVYENALHRAPDLGGLVAQLDALAHGMTRAQLVANFALAPESMQVLGQMHPVGVFTNDLVVV